MPRAAHIVFLTALALSVVTLEAGSAAASHVDFTGNFEPTWSPDGSQIAFTSSRTGHENLYVMRADGGDQRPLLTTAADAYEPAWSRQGRIAFSMVAPDEEIYVVNPDGSGLQQVTNDPGQWDFKADWSPDGTLIAFAKSEGPDAQGDFPSRIDIEIVRPDGTGLRNLTQSITPAATFNSGPAWSPDGMRIAFSTGPRTGSGTAIDVVNVDGSGLRQLTSGKALDLDPAWSPDGKWIAFSRNRGEIDLVRSDGSSERRLVTRFLNANTPQWSPDGTRIAFSELFLTLSADVQIAVVNSDGSGLRTLTGPRLPAVHSCVVPGVVGKQLKDARRMIRKSHCRVGRIRWKHEQVRKGRVLAQRPRPHRRLRAGARVNLVVSRGPIR